MNSLKITVLIFLLSMMNSLKAQKYFITIAQEFVLEHPAYFHENDDYHVSLLRKQQWKGFNTENVFVGQKSFNYDRLTIGLIIRNNTYNLELKENGLEVPFSYRINLGKGKLSLGVNPSVKKESLNYDQLYSAQPGDPIFGSSTVWGATLATGLYYKDEKVDLGLSVNNLIKTETANSVSQISSVVARAFLLTEKLTYHPVLFTRYIDKTPLGIVLKNQFEIDEKAIIAFLISRSKELSFSAGINIKKMFPRFSQNIRVDYAYSKQFAELAVLGNTHEVGLTYRWNKRPSIDKIKQTKSIQSPVIFD